MNLKFACSDQFESAEEIAKGIQGYLPNLIQNVEIVRTEAFVGIFYVWDVNSKVERIIKPDWERDVVFVVIQGSLYFADLELFELAGSTLNVLDLGRIATPPPDRPRLGGLFLPQNTFKELRGDKDYWVKTGVEEILHGFGVPEQHDEDCFFHSKAWGQGTVEDGRKDFCPKCRQLMLQLEDPLDFDEISARVEDIYGLKPRPGAGPLRGYRKTAPSTRPRVRQRPADGPQSECSEPLLRRFFRWIGRGI